MAENDGQWPNAASLTSVNARVAALETFLRDRNDKVGGKPFQAFEQGDAQQATQSRTSF